MNGWSQVCQTTSSRLRTLVRYNDEDERHEETAAQRPVCGFHEELQRLTATRRRMRKPILWDAQTSRAVMMEMARKAVTFTPPMQEM